MLLSACGRLAAAEATTWELTPYRVTLLVAVEGGALAPRAASALPGDLAARTSSAMGGAWHVDAQTAPIELRHQIATAIETIAADRLPAAALESDKVILLGLSSGEGIVRVRARELDVATRLWNTTIAREVRQPGQTLTESLRAVLSAFAPLARIETAENGACTLRLRGSGLPRRDRSSLAVAGVVFRPVLVNTDAQGKVVAGSAEPIAWTFFTPLSTSGGLVTCRVDTGLAGEAIPAYHPRRSRWALAIARSEASTRLHLVSSVSADTPLEGYDVLAEAADGSGNAQGGELLGRTDSRGELSVPPGPAAVRMLLVRQGEQILARVPIVPGLASKVVLSLPDGRDRVQIETLLVEAEDSLLDLAARREALAGRIRLATQAGETDVAAKLRTQLRGLAGVEASAALLDRASQALQAADSQSQTALQPRLDALRKQAAQLKELPLEKPVETKPDEAKAVEVKPAETKP